jgi:pimeloyl-ACP methyl ester carboxylesterase
VAGTHSTTDEFELVKLTSGSLTSSALCAGEGSVVLCLHGFPDHFHSFRHQLPAFAGAGYRAVAPMLRGYESSSQPGRNIAAHHPLHVAEDVVAWARQLGGGEPVHLIGHDWGGIAGFVACQLEPSLFRSYTSIAIPCAQALEDGIRRYPIQVRNSWYTLFFQLRGVADSVVRARDFAFIEKLWRDWSPGWSWDPQDMSSLKQTFREPGVLWSALAYYRAMLNPFLDESKRMRAMTHTSHTVPTLTLTGATDGCMDTRLFDCQDASLFPSGFEMQRVEGAGHFAHQEEPDAVNAILLRWISAH